MAEEQRDRLGASVGAQIVEIVCGDRLWSSAFEIEARQDQVEAVALRADQQRGEPGTLAELVLVVKDQVVQCEREEDGDRQTGEQDDRLQSVEGDVAQGEADDAAHAPNSSPMSMLRANLSRMACSWVTIRSVAPCCSAREQIRSVTARAFPRIEIPGRLIGDDQAWLRWRGHGRWRLAVSRRRRAGRGGVSVCLRSRADRPICARCLSRGMVKRQARVDEVRQQDILLDVEVVEQGKFLEDKTDLGDAEIAPGAISHFVERVPPHARSLRPSQGGCPAIRWARVVLPQPLVRQMRPVPASAMSSAPTRIRNAESG